MVLERRRAHVTGGGQEWQLLRSHQRGALKPWPANCRLVDGFADESRHRSNAVQVPGFLSDEVCNWDIASIGQGTARSLATSPLGPSSHRAPTDGIVRCWMSSRRGLGAGRGRRLIQVSVWTSPLRSRPPRTARSVACSLSRSPL